MATPPASSYGNKQRTYSCSTYDVLSLPFLLLMLVLQKKNFLDAFTYQASCWSRKKTIHDNIKGRSSLLAEEQKLTSDQFSPSRRLQQEDHHQQRRRRFAQSKTRNQSSYYGSDSKLGSLHKERIKTAGRKGTKRFVDPCKVFVGNIPFDVDEKQLANFILETMGQSRMELHSCKVIRDWKTGTSKGFGFVEFTDPIFATVCMDVCYGKKLNGRPIRVDQGKKKDAEDQIFVNKKKNKPESEEDKAISMALDEAESGDIVNADAKNVENNDADNLKDLDHETNELVVDDEDIKMDATVFGLTANDNDDDEDYDGIFLERPSKYENDKFDKDLNRLQRREAARRRKRKKAPSKGFG